ncbi:MAG: hypothetical protein AABX04_08270 [Nanoarchaeota archaeon]
MTIDDRFGPSIPRKEIDEDSAWYRENRHRLQPVVVFSQEETDRIAGERNASAAVLHRRYVLPSNRYEHP